MNTILQKPVGKVVLNENTPNRNPRREHYLIPYYQRGYRWEQTHVEALLDDIDNFINSGESKYCLQPIVVVPAKDKNEDLIWEVIDGQQRLITMYIIFKYINKPSYSIIFEKRNKSTDFLKNLSTETYSDENPDFHFMSTAHKIIKKWFDEKSYNDIGFIDQFNSNLTKNVELIWYQVDELKGLENTEERESKKIDIFNRLNIGKIPLTDAELIRALLLSKVKLGTTGRESLLRQAEISAEWNRIEMELRNEDFWYFLNTKELKETSSTIEFIFNLIADESKNKYSTYLWFEKQIKDSNPDKERQNAELLWIKTKNCFATLKYWFNNRNLYHHLGFLFALEKTNPIKLIKSFITKKEVSKKEFLTIVKDSVKDKISDVDLNDMNYDKNSVEVKNILLLHNILTYNITKSKEANRFPFHLYKKMKGGWSLEHIHAQESKEIKEQNAIKQWLNDTYKAIKDISGLDTGDDVNNSEKIKNHIAKIESLLALDKIEIDVFNTLKSEITQTFDSDSIHFLDNLALLSKNDNSALNNAIFPVKRNRIIQMEKEGKYIPLATKNIFLKYYSETDLQPYYWSKKDKENYFADIKLKLESYLKSHNRASYE